MRGRRGPAQGAECALVAGVPLVVCGPADSGGPLLRADVLCGPTELVAACPGALSPIGATAHRVVARAVRTALTARGTGPSAGIEVRLVLRDTTVVADITLDTVPSRATHNHVRTAVRTSLAPFTSAWAYTPVTLHRRAPNRAWS
ncbi:hypothetical protein ACWGR4_22200 [Embleya sp. NPDC055664]